jgi:hypothetical protein
MFKNIDRIEAEREYLRAATDIHTQGDGEAIQKLFTSLRERVGSVTEYDDAAPEAVVKHARLDRTGMAALKAMA